MAERTFYIIAVITTPATIKSAAGNQKGSYYNYYYVTWLGMVFMADFLFCGVGAALYFFKITAFFKQLNFLKKVMCCLCVGYKKCDIKTIEVVASGTG
ncbi:hypothetical protein ESU54_11460 [Aequorivita antarctica]|uniref:Uncharacterized protein n=1 Tax=Aequorivita antarctica TaxID=153266 RepID=A0A5C6Z012_9FLAO|nr:hypothetical protein ESU54_11460 [Aequorivita antarctica]